MVATARVHLPEQEFLLLLVDGTIGSALAPLGMMLLLLLLLLAVHVAAVKALAGLILRVHLNV